MGVCALTNEHRHTNSKTILYIRASDYPLKDFLLVYGPGVAKAIIQN